MLTEGLAAHSRPETNETLGITLRTLSTFAFALMGVCVKALGDTVP